VTQWCPRIIALALSLARPNDLDDGWLSAHKKVSVVPAVSEGNLNSLLAPSCQSARTMTRLALTTRAAIAYKRRHEPYATATNYLLAR
jgi:hypothetical protein